MIKQFRTLIGVFGSELRLPVEANRCAKCGGIHTTAAASIPSAVALAGLTEERRAPAKPTLANLRDSVTAHRERLSKTREPKKNPTFEMPRPTAPTRMATNSSNNAGTVSAPSFTALIERIKSWRR
jgi:hypothetical protein